MKPFNLEEYRKNPLRKILTRSGSKVTILCVDYNAPNKPDYPILARVTSAKGYDRCLAYTKTGAFYDGYETDDDLFFAPEKREGWIALGRYEEFADEGPFTFPVFKTETDAREEAKKIEKEWEEIGKSAKYIPVKIEWEE